MPVFSGSTKEEPPRESHRTLLSVFEALPLNAEARTRLRACTASLHLMIAVWLSCIHYYNFLYTINSFVYLHLIISKVACLGGDGPSPGKQRSPWGHDQTKVNYSAQMSPCLAWLPRSWKQTSALSKTLCFCYSSVSLGVWISWLHPTLRLSCLGLSLWQGLLAQTCQGMRSSRHRCVGVKEEKGPLFLNFTSSKERHMINKTHTYMHTYIHIKCH